MCLAETWADACDEFVPNRAWMKASGNMCWGMGAADGIPCWNCGAKSRAHDERYWRKQRLELKERLNGNSSDNGTQAGKD